MNRLFALRDARREAGRCLQCHDAPCVAACPAGIDVSAFILGILTENIRGAAEVVKTANALANVCGAVCPEEIFCQSACTRAKQDSPVAIRELHLFATREEREAGYSTPRPFGREGATVAVVGAGPAGLACAMELAKHGHRVSVYDRSLPGGVPRSSIPPFRLRTEDLEGDLKFLGRFFTLGQLDVDIPALKNLIETHDAVFLASGLGRDKPLGLPGAQLPGVMPVLPFLERAKVPPVPGAPGSHVVIVGGGNVSLDAAATAKRLGAAEVTLLYRRSEREMRVWQSELIEAREQGVLISTLTLPVGIIGRERVEGVRCRRTRLIDQVDPDGRRRVAEVEGSEFTIAADAVIAAIGQTPSAGFLTMLDRTPGGHVRVDAEFRTSLPTVFAGGDLVGGEGTIVQSVAHGKAAAGAIHRQVTGAVREARP